MSIFDIFKKRNLTEEDYATEDESFLVGDDY
jgi:hypothetical protein